MLQIWQMPAHLVDPDSPKRSSLNAHDPPQIAFNSCLNVASNYPHASKGRMVVNIGITKLTGGRIRVAVNGPGTIATQEFGSEQEGRQVLLDLGVPQDALEFYFHKIFPCLVDNQELPLPALKIREQELSLGGFRFADAD